MHHLSGGLPYFLRYYRRALLRLPRYLFRGRRLLFYGRGHLGNLIAGLLDALNDACQGLTHLSYVVGCLRGLQDLLVF